MENIKKSNLILDNRKKITLTGVKEVISYDDTKIALSTNMGNLDIKGRGLKINKLDVQNGDIIIIGTINYMAYSEKELGKNKKENIFKRLFH